MQQEREHTPALRSKQQQRTERILDATADLLLRWGYKRVTIDDIAKQTGIGTGTIYLHWKTREALFEGLMLREMVAVWRALLERIRSDPTEVLIHRMMRSLLLTVMSRPLALALSTRDSDLLGKLARNDITMQAQQMAPAKDFLTMLRNMGLLRSDINLSTQVYAFSATVTGFFLTDPLISKEDQIPLEEKAEAIAQTIHLAFEPETLPPLTILQEEIAPTMIQFLEQICDYCEQLMQDRMVSSPN